MLYLIEVITLIVGLFLLSLWNNRRNKRKLYDRKTRDFSGNFYKKSKRRIKKNPSFLRDFSSLLNKKRLLYFCFLHPKKPFSSIIWATPSGTISFHWVCPVRICFTISREKIPKKFSV